MSKVLITGHLGFIGKHLWRHLSKAEDCDLYGIDLKIGSDIRTCRLKDEYDIVYHLAAKRSVPLSFDEPEEFFSNNIWGTYRLVSLLPSARFVNISSSSAETRLSPYAISKYVAEQFCGLHKNFISLRLFNVFGPGQTDDMLIPNFARAMLKNKPVYIYGDGKQSRDFTYVEDIVKEIASFGKENYTDIWSMGYTKPRSINYVFKVMASYFKYKKKPVYKETRKGDYKYTCADDEIFNAVGFKKGMIETMNWWKNEKT